MPQILHKMNSTAEGVARIWSEQRSCKWLSSLHECCEPGRWNGTCFLHL